MKRILSILALSLLLAAVAFGAVAEDAKITQTLAALDDGCEIVLESETPIYLIFDQKVPAGHVRALASKQGAADVVINIQPEELAEGMSIGEIGDAGLDELKSIYYSLYDDPIIDELETPSGTKYIYVQSNQEGADIRSTITLFEGHFIELIQSRDDFGPLDTSDEAFAREVLEGIWFVKTH